MKRYLRSAALYLFAAAMAANLAACSSSDDDNTGGDNGTNGGTTQLDPINDTNTYAEEAANNPGTDFTDKAYGAAAIAGCTDLTVQLTNANKAILSASLTAEQENYLREVVAGVVDNVIIPTYTELADKAETLEATLNGLNVNTITQEQINKACELFGEARVQWERSEAFLGGAASDFSIDPTIDSWPLSRSKLHAYLVAGANDPSQLDDESVLGFHALEFILFRNGQPRKVAELRTNDTYNGFTDISGAAELAYAQQVCTLLKQRTFQLQVAWEGETSANSNRMAVVKAAGLGVTTQKGLSYGDDIKNAGSSNSKYSTLKEAITQMLSHDEGSALAIANEVGTAKIANPFSAGEISYVESPYSYRSITDFQDNIRSIRNVWYGNRTGKRDASNKSFYTFFARTKNDVNAAVVNSFVNTINAIGSMPAPFVKYCCTVWGKEFSEEEYVEAEE